MQLGNHFPTEFNSKYDPAQLAEFVEYTDDVSAEQ